MSHWNYGQRQLEFSEAIRTGLHGGQELTEATQSEPINLVIREPIGELVLSLSGGILTVTPDNGFRYAVADRMRRAETATRGRRPVIDSTVARVNLPTAGASELWGEHPVDECELSLEGSRLWLQIVKVRTSFSAGSFEPGEASGFVQQFNGAKELC